MSTGHGGARTGAGQKRKADSQIPPEDSGDHPGPGRPRKVLPKGRVMGGTGALSIFLCCHV